MRASSSLRFVGRRFVLCAVFTLATAATALGAPTGYADDFSGPMKGWAQSASYSLAQEDGALTLAVNKQTRWTGQYLDLGGEHDFSANPYVNLRAKTDTPCILHVYLADGENNDLTFRKLRAVSGYVDLLFDFTGAEQVDLAKVRGMIFTVNGAANSWNGNLIFDELRVGDAARRPAGIDGVHDRIHYRDSGRHSVLLTGLEGAASVRVSGGRGLIRNPSVSAVRDGQATLSYECVPGAAGRGEVALTAVGAAGYVDNTIAFGITIEDNLPPTVQQPEDMTVQVGVPQVVHLTGISDGNIAVEQPLVITADGMQVTHDEGSPHATLSFTPQVAGTRMVTVSIDDGGPGVSKTETAFQVRAVLSWNNPPTVDPVPDEMLFTDTPELRVVLTGITDGDGSGQPLEVTLVGSGAPFVLGPSVDYGRGTTARLRLVPDPPHTGTATITVLVQDRGGTADNNGDQSTRATFTVTTRVRPLGGWRQSFADWAKEGGRWRPESTMEVSHVVMDGQDAVKVGCRDKITFGGLWLDVPDLDLTEAPCLTVDVRPQDDLQFNMYFYDGRDQRNSGASQPKRIAGGRWQTVTFDFTGDGQMSDNTGQPINAGWVTSVLFNFHPRLGWPFDRYSGTVHFRNLRIGREAAVPERKPVCTIDEVADQVHLAGAGRQVVRLTGIGNGVGGAADVATRASGGGVVGGLAVGQVGPDGSAQLTYNVGAQTGKATVSVTVSVPGSGPRTVSFGIEALDAAAVTAVSIDATRQFQVIHGFGTFSNNLPVDLYAGELGASAMRVGLIANQLEPVNDNSDPSVLHRGALDYSAFDWDHYRRLHEAGVESFILTSWSPPAWMKANLSMNYQGPGATGDSDSSLNRLDYHQYEEFAESMVAAYRMFKEEAGIELLGIGLQNEPAFHEPYPSAILDARRFVELIKVVGPRLEKEGISTKLFMPEQVFSQTSSMRRYIAALNADPEAMKYCDVVATHGYDTTGTRGQSPDFPNWADMWKRSQGGGVAKELWMTETGFGYRGWDSALGTGVTIYGGLEYGNMGLSTTWSIEGQLVNRGTPNPTFYVCSQFFRHIRPGARRIASQSEAPSVLATSYVNDEAHGSTLICVLINRGDSAQAVRLVVQGRQVGKLALTRTDRVSRHAEVGAPTAEGLILLPPKSVTTVVGQ